MSKCFCIGIILNFLSVYSLQNPSNFASLTNYLQNKHNKISPPDNLIKVFIDIELVHINSIDELHQKMSAVVYMVEEWTDPSLSWDPSDFYGINHTWLPIESIWVPDIIIFNMLEYVNLLENIRMPVKIYFDGRVVYSYPALYTVMCHIEIERFPFDEQQCSFDIASWGYSEDKLLLNVSNKNYLKHYNTNDEWALKNVFVEQTSYEHEGTVVSEAKYHIQVTRKPLHYVVSLVVPCYIVCALSIAGLYARFSSRRERQERFTLGVTSILSMAVLSLVVSEKVPHSSLHVPLLIKFFLFQILLVTFATILTWPILKFHREAFKQGSKIPPEWAFKILLMQWKVKEIKEKYNDIKIQQKQLIKQGWTSIARRLDYAFATIFLFLTTAPTIYILLTCGERLKTQDYGGLLYEAEKI
uniref:Proton-gated ion channel subunit pbo-6 (inferred by orthology to a C. elegans protein) n=1 Tax=Strongyloides venezuelensis TaxID=75913 RepID=A0A0K0F3Z4_STRVS